MRYPVPESVWFEFLTDTEAAIQESAPKEPSARERAGAPVPGETPDFPFVGEPWQPGGTCSDRPRRRLGARESLRRAGRLSGALATLALLLGLFSCVPHAPSERSDGDEADAPRHPSGTAVESSTEMNPLPSSAAAS